MILLNPKKLVRPYPDPRSAEIMRKTVEFFERKGKAKLKEDDLNRTWYADFLEFQKSERVFATLLTPAGEGHARRPGQLALPPDPRSGGRSESAAAPRTWRGVSAACPPGGRLA